MGAKILTIAMIFVCFGMAACGPKKNNNSKAEELNQQGFNSSFSGAVYFDNREGYSRLDLYSGHIDKFLSSSPNMSSSSADGNRFVTIKRRSQTQPEILVLDKDRLPSVRISLPENPEGTPKLSRDGLYVLIGGIVGDTKIYDMKGEMVANLRTNITSYDWLSDGRILFSRFGTLYIIEKDFKTYRVFHQLPATPQSLAVSPDGRKVAFEMLSGENSHIWIMDLEQKLFHQITTSTVGEHYPAWSPEGHHLVVAKGKKFATKKKASCLELWIIKANLSEVSDLGSEDLVNTFRLKQNVSGRISETCALTAPLWRND